MTQQVKKVTLDRREFLKIAALSLAATQLKGGLPQPRPATVDDFKLDYQNELSIVWGCDLSRAATGIELANLYETEYQFGQESHRVSEIVFDANYDSGALFIVALPSANDYTLKRVELATHTHQETDDYFAMGARASYLAEGDAIDERDWVESNMADYRVEGQYEHNLINLDMPLLQIYPGGSMFHLLIERWSTNELDTAPVDLAMTVVKAVFERLIYE